MCNKITWIFISNYYVVGKEFVYNDKLCVQPIIVYATNIFIDSLNITYFIFSYLQWALKILDFQNKVSEKEN